MKKVFLLLALACTIVACSDEKKSDKSGSDQTATNAKSASVYKIGDYYNENGKKGVVFEVSDGGRHGKIVSLHPSDKPLQWYTDSQYDRMIRVKASSRSDGKMNTVMVMNREDSDQYPAFVWCSNQGPDWYLPAEKELEAIYNNKSAINPTLGKYGVSIKDELNNGDYYWTSTECESTHALWLHMDICEFFGAPKNEYAYVRAVATF